MDKEYCKKCGAEKIEAEAMCYTNEFDEANPIKRENFEHTHKKILICLNCLKTNEK